MHLEVNSEVNPRTSGLMAHRVPFVVAELGPEVNPSILHLFAALAKADHNLFQSPSK